MAEEPSPVDVSQWYKAAVSNESQRLPGSGAKLGRRIAQLLYFAFVGLLGGAAIVQITHQVFFPGARENSPFQSCSEGLSALYQAIELGRSAAERGPEADEEGALLRYREAVAPDWRHRDSVARLCADDAKKISVLDAIERLRYSEEHSVRHQAVELSALRQKVKELAIRAHTP